MKTLFDVATVARGDGRWMSMSGYDADFQTAGREYSVHGRVCEADAPPDDSGTKAIYRVVPFVVETKQQFSAFCEPPDAEASLRADVDAAAEPIVAHQFWNGDAVDWDGASEGVFLTDADVTTVPAGATVAASVAAALEAAWAKTPGLRPVLHLGVGAALGLAPNYFTSSTALDVVVSAGYPADGIAVTGPIKISLGDVTSEHLIATVPDLPPPVPDPVLPDDPDDPDSVAAAEAATAAADAEAADSTFPGSTYTNRDYFYGSRFAAVEFDPRLAVVVVPA